MATLLEQGGATQSMTQPISLADSMQQWGGIRDNQIAREQRLKEQPMIDKQNNLKLGLQQHQAAKQVATDVYSQAERQAQRLGIKPETPEFNQLVSHVYHANPIYAQTMYNVTNIPPDPNKPIDVPALLAVRDSTPGEQAQTEVDQAVAKDNALFSNKEKLANIQAGGDINKLIIANRLAQGRDAQNNAQAVANKAIPSYSDIQHREETSHAQALKQLEKTQGIDTQIGGIDDQIASFERLKSLQDNTTTGPLVGSGPMASVRKMSGNDDLATLEKGYAKASLDTIGIMKQAGTTLGALSEGEGRWIREANMSINSTGTVNKAVMDEGINHLKEVKKRLESQRTGQPQHPADLFDTLPPDREGYKTFRLANGKFKQVPR